MLSSVDGGKPGNNLERNSWTKDQGRETYHYDARSKIRIGVTMVYIKRSQFPSSYALEKLFASPNWDYVRGKISEHVLAPNGAYGLFILSLSLIFVYYSGLAKPHHTLSDYSGTSPLGRPCI